MLRLLPFLTVCAAWGSFASFNQECTAEMSFLRGTRLETTITAGRIPYQFKHAIQEVIKERVTAEGCASPLKDLFFGMDVQNVLNFLDGADTLLADTTIDPTCMDPFNFNWKKLKTSFRGITLPSTCTAANYRTTKKCQVKAKLHADMFIELMVEDKCTTESQSGFGLPTINFFCTGSLCNVFARPCTVPSDCGTGVTCDSLNVSLAGAFQPLVDMGLFKTPLDDATCNGATGNFSQKFWSQVVNVGANLFGLTDTISTTIYSDLKVCGIQTVEDRFVDTPRPTPAPTMAPTDFRCYNSTHIPASQVCNGIDECSYSEDERYCSCGVGMFAKYNNDTQCCPPCRTDTSPSYCTNDNCAADTWYYGGSSSGSGLNINFNIVCPAVTSGPLSCPDFLFPSTSTLPAATAASAMTGALPVGPNQHILVWGDCNGNVQLGSSAEIATVNAKLPFVAISGEIERVMRTLETCRSGVSPTTITNWARNFFPWSVNFWGGMFFSNLASTDFMANVNPGALLDATFKYYPHARNYTVNLAPPFADVANAPSSCNVASTLAGTCELAAEVGSWFQGFPAGWNDQTTIKAKVSSSCTSNALPSSMGIPFITCEGPCNAAAKSGCCMLKAAIVQQNAGGGCPSGYKLTSVGVRTTDFLFVNKSTRSNDTSMENFFQLLMNKQYRFGTASPFVAVHGSEAARQICTIDGSTFDENVEAWGTAAVTEKCPVPATVWNGQLGCPQFISGGPLKGCGAGSTACLGAAPTANCNPQCPLPEQQTANPAAMLVPVFGLLVSLSLLAL